MIKTRAPLRISFVGGGTDLPSFYRRYPGRVLSVAIQRYVYVDVNRPMFDSVILKYRSYEEVEYPRQLKHTRVRGALIDLGIEPPVEISTMSDVRAETGLGSSSAFSVALLKALNPDLYGVNLAEAACCLEIDILREPIGKQDQYASAFGGLKVYQFNPDGSVVWTPVNAPSDFSNHLLLFFLGWSRSASDIHRKQRKTASFETLKSMADSVEPFRNLLGDGDWLGAGKMLHEAWLQKRSLNGAISNGNIDALYEEALKAGAWGGKVCGAGGGGCLLVMAPQERHLEIRNALGLTEIPVEFSRTGAEIVFKQKNEDGSYF